MKNLKKTFLIGLMAALMLSSVGIALLNYPFNVNASQASTWYYTDWLYRQTQNVTNYQTALNFYGFGNPNTTISGDPSNCHAFQPVHGSTVIQTNTRVDNNTWKYLAYDSDANGTLINLYYTNDTGGIWISYSKNPIFGPKPYVYRWPSTTYINGAFNMFLENDNASAIERWVSNNGINYTFAQSVVVGGIKYKNPFIWQNPTDNRWYLYYHEFATSPLECINVRASSGIDTLNSASDTTLVTQNRIGAPSVTYINGKYWLLAESEVGYPWEISAFSSDYPNTNFVQSANSPILAADESCPTILLTSDKSNAYLYTTINSKAWYERTRQVNLNSSTTLTQTNLSDYQVKVQVNYGSGNNTPNTVNLNSKCQSDFGDIRFTWYNSTSKTEVPIPCWIEQSTAGVNATFWVKVPQIPYQGNSIIYIYYGTYIPLQTTSNAAATLEYYDNFSDMSKWTTIGGTWRIINGTLEGQTTGFGQRVRANNFVVTNNSIHVQMQWMTGLWFEGAIVARGQVPSEQDNCYALIQSTYPNQQFYERANIRNNGVTTYLTSQCNTKPVQKVLYSYVFSLSGGYMKCSELPINLNEFQTRNDAFGSGSLCLMAWSNSYESIQYSNLFVTKYSYPEPTGISWYAEETNPIPPVTPTPTPTPLPTPTSTPNPTPTPTPTSPTPTSTPTPISTTPVNPTANPTSIPTSSRQTNTPSSTPTPILQTPTPTPAVNPTSTGTPLPQGNEQWLGMLPIAIVIIATIAVSVIVALKATNHLRRK